MDDEKFSFIKGQFDDIKVTSAPAIGITPASNGVMGVTRLFVTDDTDEVTQNDPAVEIIHMCSGSENELSDTDSMVLVGKNVKNEVDKATNQNDDRSFFVDIEYPHLKLVVSAERKRSHELEQEEVDQIEKWYANAARETVKPRSVMFCLLTAFVAATTETSGVDDLKWRKACLKELAAIVKNKTFLLVELPAGKRAVGSRWLFSMKSGTHGPFEKARLVAQSFS